MTVIRVCFYWFILEMLFSFCHAHFCVCSYLFIFLLPYATIQWPTFTVVGCHSPGELETRPGACRVRRCGGIGKYVVLLLTFIVFYAYFYWMKILKIAVSRSMKTCNHLVKLRLDVGTQYDIRGGQVWAYRCNLGTSGIGLSYRCKLGTSGIGLSLQM